jgi:hypothetical protein
MIEPVPERSELAGVEDAGEFFELWFGEVHDGSSTQVPNISRLGCWALKPPYRADAVIRSEKSSSFGVDTKTGLSFVGCLTPSLSAAERISARESSLSICSKNRS